MKSTKETDQTCKNDNSDILEELLDRSDIYEFNKTTTLFGILAFSFFIILFIACAILTKAS